MKKRMVEHHVKYKELHGVDETVWMTQSEHKTLHNRLRREGKCNIPVDELRRISNLAYGRTERGRSVRTKIRTSGKSRAHSKEYNNHTEVKKRMYEYNKKNRYIFEFSEILGLNTRLVETITYNKKTGAVGICSFFRRVYYKRPSIDGV